MYNKHDLIQNIISFFFSKIFEEGKLSHFIDGRGTTGGWMSFVNCARYAQEQNMIAVQIEGDIYYEVCKDIPNGSELLVWYGDCYLQFMGVPVSLKEMADGGAQEESECKKQLYLICFISIQWSKFKVRLFSLNIIPKGIYIVITLP